MADESSKPARKPSILDPLDARLSELRGEFPGWDIWYVPRAVGGTKWCARAKPLLNCDSPGELRTAMRRADRRRLADLAAQAGQDAAPEDGTEDDMPEGGIPPGVTELPRRQRPDGVA